MDISATTNNPGVVLQQEPRNQAGAIDTQNNGVQSAAVPDAVGDTVTIRSVDASNAAQNSTDVTYERFNASGPTDTTLAQDGSQTPNATQAAQQDASQETDATQAGQQAEEARADEAQGEETEERNGVSLTEEELQQVTQLQARDTEVRAHEAAHAAVGGQYAGAPSYTFQQGPDGQRYAIGGQVMIDTSSVPGDPQATIDKMRVVIAAANAPAEPSGPDRQVANQASSTLNSAVAELAETQQNEREQQAEEAQQAAGDRINDQGRDRAERAEREESDILDVAQAGATGGPATLDETITAVANSDASKASASSTADRSRDDNAANAQVLAERTEAQTGLDRRFASTGAVEGTAQGSAIDNMV